MAEIHRGRHQATIEGDFVVFVIGLRMNRPWKVRQLWDVAVAMPRMLAYLEAHPEKGMLGYRTGISGLSTIAIQYWRSLDQLERFARDKDDPHLEPWRRFNQRVGASGDVGVYHETYLVSAGSYEAIYVNMPRTLLAAAGEMAPLGTASRGAERIAGATH